MQSYLHGAIWRHGSRWYYFGLHAQGKVEFGGPFLSVPGGMIVLTEGTSEEEATQVAVADPGISAGLLNYEIRHWLLAIK